jgi:multidrug efflux pump subunit AcrA (membrane-fusion protein)
VVSLPATTSAFSVANIYARASGYIDKREVDIGDRVKEGQLLAQITAPELDYQIAQAAATLVQLKATVQQAQANLELAQVTWGRDKPLVEKGWTTAQQGTVDVQTLKAREAALGIAQANVTAQEAQLSVLNQQKAYQLVVAPFDGVVTQRNVDVGSLVQADAVNSTFMFTLMHVAQVVHPVQVVPRADIATAAMRNLPARWRHVDRGARLASGASLGGWRHSSRRRQRRLRKIGGRRLSARRSLLGHRRHHNRQGVALRHRDHPRAEVGSP